MHHHILMSCLSVLLGLCLWQALASQVSDLILPPPTNVLSRLFDAAFERRLLLALGGFMGSLAVGFGISLAVAVPLGILIGRSPTLAQMFEPLVTAIYALPPVAFIPFLVLWFGLFFEARVALVVLMTVFDIMVVIIAGARDIKSSLVDVGRSFGASKSAQLRLIVFPALLPFLFSGVRVGIARAINGTITAELFFAAVNLGALMKRASQNFDTATVLLIVAMVSLLGLLSQTIMSSLEKHFLRWHVRL